MLNLYRVIPRTRVEGPGERFSIWVQGCPHHCPGCFARETWPFEPRELREPEDLLRSILDTPGIEGVTVLGGEPMSQAPELARLLPGVRAAGLSVILFTGYTYPELLARHDPAVEAVLKSVDVLADGPYIRERRDFSRPMVGSANQNILFLTDRYRLEDFPPNRIELRLGLDGRVQVNGMGDFEKNTALRRFLEI